MMPPVVKLAAIDIPNSGVPNINNINSTVPVVGTSNTTLPDVWNRLTGSGSGVINILLWAAGFILVISIITHAISYITAGGDSAKASKARQGLVNAALGLIVVTLVFFITRAIVAFVQ